MTISSKIEVAACPKQIEIKNPAKRRGVPRRVKKDYDALLLLLMISHVTFEVKRKGFHMSSDKALARLLGRRYIKSFASGIAHTFSCSAMHFAWIAYESKSPSVTIDLLTGKIEPSEFDIERNRILVGMCHSALLGNIKTLAPPGTINRATLTVTFGIDDYRADGISSTIGETTYAVALTDDRGKNWCVELRETRVIVDD